MKARVDAGTYDQSANDSRSSHSLALGDALLTFVTMDFAGLLRLGQLDVDGVRELCVFDEVEDVVGDTAVGLAGRNGAGADDSGWPAVSGVGDGNIGSDGF